MSNLALTENELNIEIDSTKFEYLDHDNVNLQCTNSKDFIVGKQTNFNGPVTIINCATEPGRGGADERHSSLCSDSSGQRTPPEERIVIRDKVLTASASMTIQNMAEKTERLDIQKVQVEKLPAKEGPRNLVSFLAADFLRLPVGVWIIVAAVLIGLTISLAVELGRTGDTASNLTTTEPDVLSHGMMPGEKWNHTLHSRVDWGGSPPKWTVLIEIPVKYIVISHSGEDICMNLTSCKEAVRNLQNRHIIRFGDVAYNFLVGGDGNVYEGRGWDKRSPIEGFANNKNIDINFIGDFSVVNLPTPEQIDGVLAVVQYGLTTGMISSNYSLIAANSTASTLSPGKRVYEIIKEWPNFDSDPLAHAFQPKLVQGP